MEEDKSWPTLDFESYEVSVKESVRFAKDLKDEELRDGFYRVKMGELVDLCKAFTDAMEQWRRFQNGYKALLETNKLLWEQVHGKENNPRSKETDPRDLHAAKG